MKELYLHPENIQQVTKEIFFETLAYSKSHRPELEAGKMALIIVDMQDYFLKEDGHAFVPSSAAIIPNIIRLQEFCLDKGIPVFFTRHINTLENARMMSIRFQELISEDHPFSGIHKAFDTSCCEVINKPQFDAFHETDLEDKLRENGVEQLIFTGVMTNLCVETTLRSAFVKGFDPILPVETTAAYNLEFHKSTFKNLSYGFAYPVLLDDLIEEIK